MPSGQHPRLLLAGGGDGSLIVLVRRLQSSVGDMGMGMGRAWDMFSLVA